MERLSGCSFAVHREHGADDHTLKDMATKGATNDVFQTRLECKYERMVLISCPVQHFFHSDACSRVFVVTSVLLRPVKLNSPVVTHEQN